MQRRSEPPSGASVAVVTLFGFFAVTIFAGAIGSYIGRHSTPEATAEETSVPLSDAATPSGLAPAAASPPASDAPVSQPPATAPATP
jgi:hypothetical protein